MDDGGDLHTLGGVGGAGVGGVNNTTARELTDTLPADVARRPLLGGGGGPSGARVEAVMPLSATFGLTTDLRNTTRGAGTWALELQGYA